MSHFAKVFQNTVLEVIVAEQDFIDSLPAEPGIRWIQTSYNTQFGQHTLGGTPLRKNFAAPGYIYSDIRDAFIPPKPFDAFVLNEETCVWEAPFPAPQDGKVYFWDGSTNNWEECELDRDTSI